MQNARRAPLSKRFDATVKELLERHPRAWLEFLLGLKLRGVRVVDADLSTVTSEADKVIRVGGRKPWMVHVELVSSGGSKLARRIQRYNILVRCRHQLPVQSVIVLLSARRIAPVSLKSLRTTSRTGFSTTIFGIISFASGNDRSMRFWPGISRLCRSHRSPACRRRNCPR